MTLIIDFAPDEEARLRERAAAAGKDLTVFIREAALEKAERPTLAELLAPIHAATATAGASTEEIDAMADRARSEVRAERRTSRNNEAP
jgi:molecular chaperone DnaK (HSP70)